jgi:hypothetical protein
MLGARVSKRIAEVDYGWRLSQGVHRVRTTIHEASIAKPVEQASLEESASPVLVSGMQPLGDDG